MRKIDTTYRGIAMGLMLITAGGCGLELSDGSWPPPVTAHLATPLPGGCEGGPAQDAATAYFVAPDRGDDESPGTTGAPLGTIQTAIDMAHENGGGTVYVAATGDYEEALTLRPGVLVIGGYESASWRSCAGRDSATLADAPPLTAQVDESELIDSDAIVPPGDRAGTPDK